MKLKHLFSAVAACGLIAGAAYAQSDKTTSPSGAANDTTSGASGSMATPNAAGDAGAAGNNGSMTGSAPAGATTAPTGSSSTTGATTGAETSSRGVNATSATTYGQTASVTVTTTTNGPVPDTPENRQRFGGPNSHAGRRTAAKGN